MATYTIKLLASNQPGAKPTMWRGGKQFSALVPEVLDLTKEEAQVFKDDPRFTIKKGGSGSSQEPTETAAPSQNEPREGNNEGPKDDDTTKTETSQDQSPAPQEEATDEVEVPETTLDDLLQLSRADLNKSAAAIGIQGAEDMNNKTQVAEAILAA